jgi:hypothetical protein
MAYGLTNAPMTFQSLMNKVLCRFVLVFSDDIMIYIMSFIEHLQHMRAVISTLCAHNLFLKRSKCSFVERRVEYLGHFMSKVGVAMDPTKIEAVQSWPTPRTLRALHGFLDL